MVCLPAPEPSISHASVDFARGVCSVRTEDFALPPSLECVVSHNPGPPSRAAHQVGRCARHHSPRPIFVHACAYSHLQLIAGETEGGRRKRQREQTFVCNAKRHRPHKSDTNRQGPAFLMTHRVACSAPSTDVPPHRRSSFAAVARQIDVWQGFVQGPWESELVGRDRREWQAAGKWQAAENCETAGLRTTSPPGVKIQWVLGL